jgi:lipid II:glycine glycyltransferase (peptidoglycan interpeptide bridge formation enzyme)
LALITLEASKKNFIVCRESSSQYIACIDRTDSNPEWDLFVNNSDMGSFYQTSSWAQVKKSQGWSALRVILKTPTNDICGGGQVFFKQLMGFFLTIQLPKGPIFDPENPEMAFCVLNEIKQYFSRKPFILLIQPADNCWDFLEQLQNSGYGSNLKVDLEEKATITIDVSKDREEILKQIKKSKRNQFRQSEIRGLVCYETTDRKDLETFYALHKQIADKRNFGIQSKLFFESLWDHFFPSGQCHLFMAEVDKQPVASIMAITFLDTLHIYRLGWSDGYRLYLPNEGIYWFAIRWANEHNYHWVDLGGIDLEVAGNVLEGREQPEWVNNSYNGFKLHISENIVLAPGTMEYFNPRLLAESVRFISNYQSLNQFLKRVYKFIRKR